MKLNKILALSAIFACGLTLAACNQTPTEQPTTEQPTTVEPTTEQPTTVEPTTEEPTSEAPAFNAAAAVAESVYVTYKDDVLRMEDFKLPTKQITYDDADNMIVVDLAWELVFVDGIEGAVTAGEIDEDGNANFHVVYDAEHSTEVTNFKLICKVTDANGNEETIELNYNVPAFKYATYQEFADACNAGSTDVLNVAGTVVAVYKTGVYLIDEQGYGFYAYSPVFEGTMDQNSLLAAYPIGSKVIASGTAALYNGQYEFAKGCSVKLVEAGSDYVIPYQDATEAFASAVSAKDKAALDHLQNTVVSINDITIADIDAANFYYYFTVGESNVKFYLRTSGSFNDFTNEKVNEIVKEWTEGYKANIKGLVTVYSGSYYITPIELDAVEITSRALSDAAKVEIGLGVAEREYGITYEAAGEYELPATDENGVAYTYEVLSGETIKVENGKLVVTPGAEKSQNVLKVTAKIGEIEESTEITVEVASALPTITSVADALLLEDGSQVYLEVTVDKVTSEWSDQYGNMRIDVTDGTGTLDCYRFSTKVEAGQKLLVKGTISSYNGKKQLAQGGTAEVLAYNGMNTVSEALALEDGAKVAVLGTVKEINTEWSEQYGNITVTIVDALGNELYVYRMGTNVNVGDRIVVDGVMGSYKGAKQVAQGSKGYTVEEWLAAHTGPTPVEVTVDATNATIFTGAEGETPALSDVTIALDANGNIIFASYTVSGYGGPADGFYHDGNYTVNAGQTSGIFSLDEQFAGWPTVTPDGQNAWTLYTVVVPEGGQIITGDVATMLPIVNEIFGANLTEMTNNTYFETTLEDGAYNHYTVKVEVQAPVVEGQYVAAYTGDTTANMKADINNAESLGLDPTIWTVTSAITGTQKNHAGLNKAGQIRFYANSGAAGYSEVTFTCVDMIETLVVELGEGKNAYSLGIYVDGVKVVANEDGSFTINSNSFVIYNDANVDTSSQLWVTSLTMQTGEGEEVPPTVEPAPVVTGSFDADVLRALYLEMYGVEIVKGENDKGLVPADNKTLDWLQIEGDVQLRTNDSDPKLEVLKNETGALSYTATGKVVVTVQLASTSKTNSSSFALKVGDAYVACDQDATALVGTVDTDAKKIVGPEGAEPEAATLYELEGSDNVYMIYGSGSGITLTWTIDATDVEGGLKLSFVSPDAGFGRGVRVLEVSVDAAE